MAAKPRLWRELEGLPAEALEEVEEFVTSLKPGKGVGSLLLSGLWWNRTGS